MGMCIQEYQKVVDAEWAILYEKLEKIVSSGAKVVLSKLPIGDVATQYFADRCVCIFVCELFSSLFLHPSFPPSLSLSLLPSLPPGMCSVPGGYQRRI